MTSHSVTLNIKAARKRGRWLCDTPRDLSALWLDVAGLFLVVAMMKMSPLTLHMKRAEVISTARSVFKYKLTRGCGWCVRVKEKQECSSWARAGRGVFITTITVNIREEDASSAPSLTTRLRSCQFWVWPAGYHISPPLFPVIRSRESQRGGRPTVSPGRTPSII